MKLAALFFDSLLDVSFACSPLLANCFDDLCENIPPTSKSPLFSGIPPASNSACALLFSINYSFLLAKHGDCWEHKFGQPLWYIYTYNNHNYIYTYVFNQYKIDLECCRKYASIIHMDDSMIKENMNLSSLHYLELCSLCIHTTHTCYAVLFAMFFFLQAFVKKLRRSDRAMGQLLRILVMFVSYTWTSVSKDVVGGFGARTEKPLNFVSESSAGTEIHAAGFLCTPICDQFLFEVSKHLSSSVTNNGTGPKNWKCKSPKEMGWDLDLEPTK